MSDVSLAVAMRDKIRGFIEKNFYIPEGQKLPDDSSLLDNGVIDSTGVLELIAFLEQNYGITVEDHEVLPVNLDSIDQLATFVERKRAA